MNVSVIPIVTGVLRKISKGLAKGLEDLEIEGRVETIQTTSLLISARIYFVIYSVIYFNMYNDTTL